MKLQANLQELDLKVQPKTKGGAKAKPKEELDNDLDDIDASLVRDDNLDMSGDIDMQAADHEDSAEKQKRKREKKEKKERKRAKKEKQLAELGQDAAS